VKGEIHKGEGEDREGKAGEGRGGEGNAGDPLCVFEFPLDNLCDYGTVINL